MSYINSYVKCLFGRTVGGDQAGRAMAGSAAQTLAESITATTSRVCAGSQKTGHFSYHLLVSAGAAPVGTLTVWYSNLPDPDPTVDGHWVQDASIAAVDLSIVANTFGNVGNVSAQHVRFKVTRTSGTLAVVLWVRAEGSDF